MRRLHMFICLEHSARIAQLVPPSSSTRYLQLFPRPVLLIAYPLARLRHRPQSPRPLRHPQASPYGKLKTFLEELR
jgi:hypothetical protein